MNEIWKDIEYFKGRYQVSNLGRIRNSKHYIMKKSQEKMVMYVYRYLMALSIMSVMYIFLLLKHSSQIPKTKVKLIILMQINRTMSVLILNGSQNQKTTIML